MGLGFPVVNYPDVNVTLKKVEDFVSKNSQSNEKHLAITKIFKTFQGEMPFAGQPAYFIRLAGCNRGKKINCSWCDTEFSLDNATVWKVTELVSYFHNQAHMDDIDLIVITGGEPLLQLDAVLLFIKTLYSRFEAINKKFPKIQFETNGDFIAKVPKAMKDWTFDFDPEFYTGFVPAVKYYNMHFVISPKTVKTGYSQNLSKQVQEFINFIPEHAYLRCAVSSKHKDPYSVLPIAAYNVPRKNVYVSPITVYDNYIGLDKVPNFWDGISKGFNSFIDKEQTRKNYEYAISLCNNWGFRLSHQMHLMFNIE